MVLSLLILTFFLTISPNAAAEKAAFFEALSREIDNNSNSYTSFLLLFFDLKDLNNQS